MGNEILHLAAVTAGLSVLFILPFIPVAFVLHPKRQWPHIVLTSCVVGTCLQATTGLIWSHLAGEWPYGEIAVLAALWAVLLFWCLKSLEKSRARRVLYDDIESSRHYLLLAVMLVIAFAVRSLHPLEAAYLGQSDAYTHLHYLKDIVKQGHLSNPSYPPGYHWLLALPVLIFSLDPYLVARFSGAFFGTALVLAVFVMMERMFSRRAAYLSGFIAACFPPMLLLMKTGVGSFANQFGLFLLPMIFLLYFCFVTGKGRTFASALLLVISLCGLAATVPMMFLHVLVIFVMLRLFDLCRLSKHWFSKTAGIILIVAIPLTLLAFHMSSVGSGQRLQTANTLIEYKEKKVPLPAEQLFEIIKKNDIVSSPGTNNLLRYLTSSPYYALLTDYFSIKRLGFGNMTLNLLGSLLALIFLGFSTYGLVAGKVNFLILGLWGMITTVQAASGFLQFSSYQREGWSLLIATCCMSGIFAAWLVDVIPGHHFSRIGLTTVLVSAAVWTFLHPPRHGALKTEAEDQLVRSVRFFGKSPEEMLEECSRQPAITCQVAAFMQRDLPIQLITRRFTGWGNQGEITPNVLQRKSNLQVIIVDNSVAADLFKPGHQYIALVDRQDGSKPFQTMSTFAMVTPSMVKAILEQQVQLYKINARILDIIKDLPEEKWLVKDFQLSDKLTAFAVISQDAKAE